MNFLHVVGRLGKDPEVRYDKNGKKLTILLVATNVYDNGKDETIWFRFAYWGDRWDKMLPHLTKGKPVMVGGKMKPPRPYMKDGQPMAGSIDVMGEYIEFLPYGKSDQQPGFEGHSHQAHSAEGGGHSYGGGGAAGSFAASSYAKGPSHSMGGEAEEPFSSVQQGRGTQGDFDEPEESLPF